jgi:sugar phosphate isomerase/epimerase
MLAISRRAFLEKSAAVAGAGFVSAASRGLYANPLGLPIGSQTYPHRQRVRDGDFAGLCKDMANIGVGILELCSPGYAEFASLTDGKQTRKVIEDHGLKCTSAHFELSELRTKQAQAIAWAKDVGMTQMGTASLSGQTQNGVATMDVVKRSADEYNKIGEVAAKAGIVQFLHDEGFEMARVDGRLVYEVLFELLDPKFVKMQFQMSAMRTVGDPVMYFTKYPGRIVSIHLQGVDLNPPPAAPAAPPTPAAPAAGGQAAAGGQGARGGRGGRGGPQLAVGKDSVDWAKVFAAAKAGGVKNYFVEQNWDLTVQSVAYLKTLNV